MNLQGAVALVTGGSRGIGKAIAKRLAEESAAVAVNYRSDERAATETVDSIRAAGGRASTFQADVADPAEAERLVESVSAALGPIDVLVNNVGEFFLKPVAEMDPAEWRRVMESNLSSAFYVSRCALPAMRARGEGRIVNVGLSPVHLVRGAPNLAAYSVAKTGVVILSRTLAAEEARGGITVNCVSPGLIDNGYLPPEQEEWMRKRVPAGRLGRPEEVAEAVAFLASARASYVSGANLAVSGAWDWEDRPTDHDTEVHELFVGGHDAR